MNYNNLGIMLWKKCSASCEICCVSSNPNSSECLDIEWVKNYIKSSKEISAISMIGFTGGEAFLNYEILLNLVEEVHNAGKQCGVVTNGFWANEYESVLEKLIKLKRVGLTKLAISYDEFHMKYIPVKNILNILKASKELNISLDIKSVIVKNSKVSYFMDEIVEYLPDIGFEYIPCYPVGEAKKYIEENNFIRNRSSEGCLCRKSKAYSIRFDGTIWPCCSPYVYDTKLCIGDVENCGKSVQDSLNRIQNHKILYVLRNFGFDYFIDIAKKELSIEIPEKIISSCELCELFFKEENFYKFLPYVSRTINEIQKQKNKAIKY